jgi:hypothetical protein
MFFMAPTWPPRKLTRMTRRIDVMSAPCRLVLQLRTYRRSAADDARGRQQTHAAQQINFHHSITSSARTKSVGGIVNPSALAVFRLMTS